MEDKWQAADPLDSLLTGKLLDWIRGEGKPHKNPFWITLGLTPATDSGTEEGQLRIHTDRITPAQTSSFKIKCSFLNYLKCFNKL